MERKTKIQAETGKQDLVITREFDLPVDLLFKAHQDPEIIEQWMGTTVLKYDAKRHGSYHFETAFPKGGKFGMHGTFHEFTPKRIIRTFEMEGSPFGIQFDVMDFEAAGEDKSKLVIHSIYESPEFRDEQLKLPFSYGINMAHDKLQEIVSKLK